MLNRSLHENYFDLVKCSIVITCLLEVKIGCIQNTRSDFNVICTAEMLRWVLNTPLSSMINKDKVL